MIVVMPAEHEHWVVYINTYIVTRFFCFVSDLFLQFSIWYIWRMLQNAHGVEHRGYHVRVSRNHIQRHSSVCGPSFSISTQLIHLLMILTYQLIELFSITIQGIIVKVLQESKNRPRQLYTVSWLQHYPFVDWLKATVAISYIHECFQVPVISEAFYL